MDQLNPDERDPSVTAVAAVSLVAGLACTLAPAATARLAGIDATPAVVRVVGLVDLALARGLFVGRPSWPWLLARAASNPAIHCRRVTGVSPITTRPSGRCRPCRRHRLRPPDRRPAPRPPLTAGNPRSPPAPRVSLRAIVSANLGGCFATLGYR